MDKPLLVDLFCSAGGIAKGYAEAGFEVVGVDIDKQPRYPYEFVRWDALTIPLDEFDAIHASPPCQSYSITRHGHSKQYPKLIGLMRERLKASGLPWVIENVVGAPLIAPATVCGTAFGLEVTDDDGMQLYLRRHRLFEASFALMSSACWCAVNRAHPGFYVGGVYGGARRNRHEAQNVRHGGYVPSFEKQKTLMGIDWMTQDELHEAIPPAYGEFIGKQLIAEVMKKVAA